MNVILLAAAYATLTAPTTTAPVKVTVNAKNGDTISGERTFRVTVSASNAVTGVEFYSGSDLRDKDTSTPYQFTYDTLLESDGKITLKFRAFTTEGEEGSATVNLTIDNGMSKGLQFHLDAAQAALSDSKWDAGIVSARVALKVDAKSTEARYLLARAYLGKGQLDKAQKFAEDAVESAPNDTRVGDLVTAIRLKQAFMAVNRPGSDRTEVLNGILAAYTGAIDARRKVVDAAVDAVGAPTAQNTLAYADANLRAGRYGAVVSALEAGFKADPTKADIGNRLAYAQMRIQRAQDALTTLQQVKKYAQPNAYTYALLSVALGEAGDGAGSDEALKSALLEGADDPSVLSAQAYLALKFVRRNSAGRVLLGLNYDDAAGLDAAAKTESRRLLKSSLDQLMVDNGNRTEVLTYASALNNRLDDFSKAQSQFELAVLTDPLNADAYIEQANRSVALTQRSEPTPDEIVQRLDTARVHFEAALAAQPSSAEALTGLSLVNSMLRKYDDAIKWGEAAVRSAGSYAAARAALSAAYTEAATGQRAEADRIRNTGSASERASNEPRAKELEASAAKFMTAARDAARQAATLDRRADGVSFSNAKAAWRYFYTGGRTPLLPLPRVQ